ncbi:MAG: hypothetical protein ABEJ24_03500 [Candidatus Magasanikbacteria bacterium]
MEESETLVKQWSQICEVEDTEERWKLTFAEDAVLLETLERKYPECFETKKTPSCDVKNNNQSKYQRFKNSEGVSLTRVLAEVVEPGHHLTEELFEAFRYRWNDHDWDIVRARKSLGIPVVTEFGNFPDSDVPSGPPLELRKQLQEAQDRPFLQVEHRGEDLILVHRMLDPGGIDFGELDRFHFSFVPAFRLRTDVDLVQLNKIEKVFGHMMEGM